ncbi:MAG: hypothetical protein J0L82_12675 [Deltaproteobacteria bacterium]|nr:hypothetical protein [Deltaproteobacteria bacterium]
MSGNWSGKRNDPTKETFKRFKTLVSSVSMQRQHLIYLMDSVHWQGQIAQMVSQNTSAKRVKLKLSSFEDYVGWALKKLTEEIPGLSIGPLVSENSQGTYRRVTYELEHKHRKVSLDFEMESNFEWYTGNKQDDPDWVYSPAQCEYQIWGGVQRLAQKLNAR